MATTTKKVDAVIDGLVKAGYHEQNSPSRKYRKFVKGNDTLWVGKKGALRRGRTVSESMSLSWDRHDSEVR